MRILYFAHDLNDTAVARRVRMLHIGGAEVKLLGFYRSLAPARDVEGVTPVDLGQTFDGKLGHRTLQVMRRSLEAARWRHLIRWADILLARNLEMTVISNAARRWARTSVPLVYECLDIHTLSAADGAVPNFLRNLERYILGRSRALIVSSPKYIDEFFVRLGITLPELILAENKRVLTAEVGRPKPSFALRHPPWKVGWFGNLRCKVSFDMLIQLAQRHPGLVEFILRGRPTDELQRKIDQHLPLRNMRFEGRYDQSELASMYNQCDFTWVIERNPNRGKAGDWVLANRLYEGGFYNVPAIALAGTASADWLRSRNAGVPISSMEEMDRFFVNLTTEQYLCLKEAAVAIPTSDFVWSANDCRGFTSRLARTACC
jgi:succinoglycan biosynthesis protein ExoL